MIRRLAALLAALAAALTLASVASASVTPDAGVITYNRPVCGTGYVPINLGHGNYFSVFNQQDHLSCVSAEAHHLSWGVASRTQTADGWQYPNISSGWEWGRYTCQDGRSALPTSPGSKCMRYPVQERNDGTPLTSVSTSPNLLGGNVAYDIWFNKTDAHPGQDNGAEIMIWLAHPGVTLNMRAVCWDATIGGKRYYAYCWTARRNGQSWNYVAYIAVTQTSSMGPTWLNEFFRNAIAHGKLSASWWLTAIDFGSEISRARPAGPYFRVKTYSLSGVR